MSDETPEPPKVVALAGGVGGARLVAGLDRVLPDGRLSAIVNTGDDFRHWGLHISPDLDTVMYTLAGLSPEDRGWGIAEDTFEVLGEMRRRNGETWFRLGDRDLVTHVARSEALAGGKRLTEATAEICQSLGVTRPILPMSDDLRPTTIVTASGQNLEFQDWLVRRGAAPEIEHVVHAGGGSTTPEVQQALEHAALTVVCPSNPYVSIEPILALEGVRETLRRKPTIAVSPLIAGKAVKGPLVAMIEQLQGMPAEASVVAARYGSLLDAFVVQDGDAFDAPFPVYETNILIQTPEDRDALARELLELAAIER